MNSTLCGLQGENIVISEHNWNGTCKCLGCSGCLCHECDQRKKIIQESIEKNESRLERCIACIKQR